MSNKNQPKHSMPEYAPGSRRHTADYEATLRAIINGDYDNVTPVRGALHSLVGAIWRDKARRQDDK